MENNQKDSAFVNDTSIYDKPIKAIPKPTENISIDTDNEFIDNINKLEFQYEKEAIKAITDVTSNALDTKYQFRDNAVDVIAYNLVIPINEAMIKVQLEVIRALAQAMKMAELMAKALVQKALRQLMGLLGA